MKNGFLFSVFFLFLFTGAGFSKVARCFSDADSTIFEVMLRGDTLLEMTLEMDMKRVKSFKQTAYQPAVLRFSDKENHPLEFKVEVKPRGHTRREICDFPPLKLRFLKEDMETQGLKNYRKIELATVCKGVSGYEQYLLKEYVAYKLYNMISLYSFRVQLAVVNFVDKVHPRNTFQQYAILIESTEEMVGRLKAKELKPRQINTRLINHGDGEVFSMFQFMIGNTDWYVPNRHNVKLLGISGTSTVIPVPYDFDYSGLVNAPYAIPHEILKIQHVTERYYQGFCREERETMETIGHFMAKKEETLRYCREFPHFHARTRKAVVEYIESFYEVIENSRLLRLKILQHCNQFLGRE